MAAPKGPGKSGYLVGAAIIVLGGILGVVLLVVGFSSVVKAFSFPQEVNSDGSIAVNHTGNFIVYTIGPQFEGTSTAFHPTVSVTSPDGTPVFAGDYTSGRSTSRGTREANAVATFTAPQTGRYVVTSSDLAPGETLGVGNGTKVQGGMIALGFAVGGLSFLVGIVVLIVTAARRSRAKPRPMMPAYGAQGYGPPGYGNPGYGPAPGTPPPSYGPPPGHGPPPAANPWATPPASPPGQWSQPAPPQAPSPAAPPASTEWWQQQPQPGAPQNPSPPPSSNDPDQSGWASPS